MGGNWWIADYWNTPEFGPVWVVSWLVWVIVSIVLHELSHGWAAIRLGDQTPRLSGHMTWNPLVHMGGYSLLALALVGIAWGAMPIDPTRLRGRHAEALVAAAGPAMNLVLAAACLVCLIVWEPFAAGELISFVTVAEPLNTNLSKFFRVGVFLNLLLFMFNLIPAYPLDGGRIAAEYIPSYRRLLQSENGQWISLGIMLLFFFFAGRVLAPAAIEIIKFASNAAWTLMGVSP